MMLSMTRLTVFSTSFLAAALLTAGPASAQTALEGESTAPSADAEEEAPNYRHGPGTARDDECLICHAGLGEEEAPKLNLRVYRASIHAEEGCIGCHPGVEDPDIAHEEEDEDLPLVDCGECHEHASDDLVASIHRDEEALERAKSEDPEAELPACKSCHGMHDIFPSNDPRSSMHPVNQTEACGDCHDDATHATGHRLEVPDEYREVVERANVATIERLMSQGELVAAACSNCHGGHTVAPSHDPQSSLHPTNVNATCGRCHSSAVRAFEKSAHAKATEEEGFEWKISNGDDADEAESDQPPVCSTCHDIHNPVTPSTERFRIDIVRECGTCHADLMVTYQKSYHGKATLASDVGVAKCSDCHGYHEVHEISDEASALAGDNRVKTCRKCHAAAPPMFASYMPHADAQDAENYPILFWVFVPMTGLVVAVFLFFGLHTLLWALRDTIEVLRHGRPRPMFSRGPAVRRFRSGDRIVHACIMVAFIGLAATGAPLRFAETTWTQAAFELTGGPEVAGWLHRIFGLLVLAGFVLHLALISIRMWPHIVGGRFLKFMMGPESLVPRPGDLIDVFANLRYFLGLGPKPSFDRWTYWEKFTYWAVFWTVPILGFSGLVLWIPEAITNVLPGWMINVAGLVHSDQALLTIGFVFLVHFFNSSLRPSKFPLDESIFTGSVPLEAYKRERPLEWARLEREGRTEQVRTEPPSRGSRFLAYLIGILGWAVGLAVLAASVAGFIATR